MATILRAYNGEDMIRGFTKMYHKKNFGHDAGLYVCINDRAYFEWDGSNEAQINDDGDWYRAKYYWCINLPFFLKQGDRIQLYTYRGHFDDDKIVSLRGMMRVRGKR